MSIVNEQAKDFCQNIQKMKDIYSQCQHMIKDTSKDNHKIKSEYQKY